MKVLHILNHSAPVFTGYSYRTLALLEQQRKLGIETAHLTSGKQREYHTPVEESNGFSFYRTPLGNSLIQRTPVLNQFQIIQKLRKRIEEILPEVQPDLLHAHSPSLTGLAALPVARKHRIPLVYEIRAFWEDAVVDQGRSQEGDLRYRLTRRSETRVLQHADHAFPICDGLRQDILERGIPEQRLTVIPNGVNPANFLPEAEKIAAIRQRFQLENRFCLGFFGSFFHFEGIPLLIEAVDRLKQQIPEILLLLVGDGEEAGLAAEMVQQRGLSSHVILPGRMPHSEISACYHAVDAMVYARSSSRITELVTPLKPLEAMASGTPVIASAVGGHQELIQDGQTGLLFEPGNPEDLCNKLRQLYMNQGLRETLRLSGIDYVSRERTWAHSASRYLPVYKALVKQTQGSRKG